MNPKVSVVVPTFNAELTIEAALMSVLCQTMSKLEVLVCDDGSSDSTMTKLATIEDSRVTVIRNETNRGAGYSRDRAIAAASGEWIALLDADDVWSQDRLMVLLEAAVDGEDMLVFDDLLECHHLASGELVPYRRLRGPGAMACPRLGTVEPTVETFMRQERLLVQPIFPTRVVRRDRITHGNTAFGEDTEFVLKLIAAGCRLKYVDRAMYRYRLTPSSANTNPKKHRLMREAVERCLSLEGFSEADRAAIARKVRELRKNEVYADTLTRLRSGHLRSRMTAAGELLSSTWMLGRLARRVVDDSAYQMHRLLHGGRGRR